MLQAGHELFSYPHFSIFSYIDKNSLSYVLIQPPTKFAKFGAIDRNLGCRPAGGRSNDREAKEILGLEIYINI